MVLLPLVYFFLFHSTTFSIELVPIYCLQPISGCRPDDKEFLMFIHTIREGYICLCTRSYDYLCWT